MQTFMPLPDARESLRALDNKRLGKQRSETLIIYRTLAGHYPSGKGWTNHPAVKMWRGFGPALEVYYDLSLDEWESRGFENNMLRFNTHPRQVEWPWWMGCWEFHESHQANLIAKDPAHYHPLWPDIVPGGPYLWPEDGYDTDPQPLRRSTNVHKMSY